MAPDILIRTDARSLQRMPNFVVPGRRERICLLRAAWQEFTRGTVHCGPFGAQNATEFRATLWETAGYPTALTDRWISMLTGQLAALDGDSDGDDLEPGAFRAPTLVALPGNTFTCLESVITASLSGEVVWIRPSTREPFSALRLVAALVGVGWPGFMLAMYPTNWTGLRTLIEVTERQIIYGGATLAATLGAPECVEMHGPMRVVATVAADIDPDLAVERLLGLVAADGGRFCTSLRTILCMGEAEPIAAGLARRMDSIPLSPPDPSLPVCAWPDDAQARSVLADILRRDNGEGRRVTSRPILVTAGQATYLAPTLFSWSHRPGEGGWDAAPPIVGLEVPFPFATITRVSQAQATAFTATADIAHHIGQIE